MVYHLPDVLIPADDAMRVQALRCYDLDTPTSEPVFDLFARLAAHLLAMPVGLISLVEQEEVVFKGTEGFQGPARVKRNTSLCAAAVLTNDPIVFHDLTREGCHLIDSVVARAAGLRFYAAAPLVVPTGYNIGTLCVMDHQPHLQFPHSGLLLLRQLVALVAMTVELRQVYGAESQHWQQEEVRIAGHLNHIDRMIGHFNHVLPAGADRTQHIEAVMPWLNSMGFILQHKLEVRKK